MQESGGGKAIKVTPEELVFDQLTPNNEQTQELVFKNNLSAPVDIMLKTSNQERVQIEPKSKRLAPFESFTAEVTAKIQKQQISSKTQKFKEVIKIQSDFFDQKVNVTLMPSLHQSSIEASSRSRDNSLQASSKILKASRQGSKSPRLPAANLDQEKESDTKDQQIDELNNQLKLSLEDVARFKGLFEDAQARLISLEEKDHYSEYLVQVKQLLREREPNLEKLMDITLRKERDAQELKDSKVLEILKIKDRQIEDLQQRVSIQQVELSQLSQTFTDQKRQISFMEEKEIVLNKQVQDLENQLDLAQSKLDSYEKGKEYKRLLENESQLKETLAYLQDLQTQFDLASSQLQQKDGLEVYFEEMLQRSKDQILEKDQKITSLMAENQTQKELRIRTEEQLKALEKQVRDDSSQKLSSEALQRVNRLQDEKSQLQNQLEQVKLIKLEQDDQLRSIVDRLTEARPPKSATLGQRNLMELLNQRVDDLIHSSIQSDQTLEKLVKQTKEKDQEYQVLLSDNKKLSIQIHELVSKKTLSRPVQTEIELDDVDILDEIKEKCAYFEDQNDSLVRQLREKDKVIQNLQKEFHKNELQNLQKNDLQSQLSPQNVQEEVIQRLNARISQLKVNEDLLLQELNKMRMSQTASASHEFSSNKGVVMKNNPFLEEKINEYEAIVYEQRESLIRLEEDNANLKRQVKEITTQNQYSNEQSQIRIKNLTEINRKQEQIYLNQQTNKGHQFTNVEQEKLRQTAQNLELENLSYKHQIQELQVELNQQQDETRITKEDLVKAESLIIRLRQDLQLSRIATNNENTTSKMIEQRKQIKYLQGLLIRAKQDFDQLQRHQQFESLQPSSLLKFEEISKTNEKMRKEHHQAIMAVIDLKEEYSSKLISLNEQHESIRQKLLKENSIMASKVDNLELQMSYMEKKEARLFGQLEEAKQIQAKESEENDSRHRELEDLILQKEATISELEREIRTKEKTLMERQEQISVLISTLESEHSRDELRQKVLNLSAELCSLKAIESQQVRKLNDLNHNLKKVELQSSKHQKALELQLSQNKSLTQNLSKSEQEIFELNSRLSLLSQQLDEVSRDLIFHKSHSEKLDYQLKLKDESIQQLRDQLKTSESMFKEEVERIRKDFFQQVSKEFEHSKNAATFVQNPNGNSFKAALHQVNITLNEVLMKEEGKVQEANLIKEFENALKVAGNTIEKMQNEIDKSQAIALKFKADIKCSVLNKILLQRQEQLLKQINSLKTSQQTREDQRSNYFKQQEVSYQKIIREQDLQIALLKQELSSVEQENSQISDELLQLRDLKDELQQNLLLFDQELENKRQVMEKRAELTVDERYKSKHESIKCYLDSQLTRILLNQSSSADKTLELGREALSLKLLVQKLETLLLTEQSDCQSLELTLAHYKQQHASQEKRVRELNAKIVSMRGAQIGRDKVENEKRRLVVSNEKEIIKLRDQLEQKSNECIRIQERITMQEGKKESKDDDRAIENDIQKAERESIIQNQKKQIEELQERLLEFRSQHIEEIENLKTKYDLELSEQKRFIHQERQLLEKRFMPGHAPGDIQEENQELVRRIQDLKSSLDQVMQDNAIASRKFENEVLQNDSLRREVEGYKQALVELEQTMIEIGGFPLTNEAIPQASQRERSSSRGRELQKSKQMKRNTSKKLKLLHRDPSASGVDESCSLATSVITMNENQNLRPNQQQGKQFMINPPAIVRALVQSKIQELQILKKYDELLLVEVELRHKLKGGKLQELQSQLNQSDELDQSDVQKIQKRLFELEIENQDLKIQKAHEQVDQLQYKSQNQIQTVEKIDYPRSDSNLFIESLIFLSNHIAILESGFNQRENNTVIAEIPQKAIEEAQRIVIKSLTSRAYNNGSLFDGQNYVPPSDHQDRKLWYLELLEQQVNASENVTSSLQSFIKKLQIDISGNLQSAASIKSASMDLANNLKKTSDEVKTLRHIIGLAKHDLNKITVPSQQQQNTATITNQKTLNPFTSQVEQKNGIQLLGATSSQSIYNQLMSQQDQLQNQLTITEKVKKTLEDELVNLKIAHQQELSSINQRLQTAIDQRNSMLQSNEELHSRVENLQKRLEELKSETVKLAEESTINQNALLEKEREKQIMAQNKTATSKHLQKLQQDMQEWRRQTDENQKIKEKQIEDLQTQLSSLQKEKDRLKSENQMLRRVDKDRRTSENEDVKKLQDEIQSLTSQLESLGQERKRELEFWLTERATMREMIDQLENEKLDQNNNNPIPTSLLPTIHSDEALKAIKKKSNRKVKDREIEIKRLQKVIEDLKDEIHKDKQIETQMSQRLREANAYNQECEERIKYCQQKIKELELERDLVLAEKNNAISSNDVSAQQIQAELNSLRECFAKLKVERDNLLYDIEETNCKEREWRQTVERLSEEVQRLEQQISSRERDQGSNLRVLESKNQTLLNDMKFLRSENDKLKERISSLDSKLLQQEQNIHNEGIKKEEAIFTSEELRRQLLDARSQLKKKEDEVSQLQEQQIILEGNKVRELEQLKEKIEETKEANNHMIQLYDNQIQELRMRFVGEKKKTENQVEQIVNLAQREAVIKSLKKELTATKSALVKVKAKNKEFKYQIMNTAEKENSSMQNSASTKQSSAKKSSFFKPQSNFSRCDEDLSTADRSVIKLAQILNISSDNQKAVNNSSILDNLQKYTKNSARIIELEAELEKQKTMHAISKEQILDMKGANEDLRTQLDDLSERFAQYQKETKSGGQSVKGMQEMLENTKQQLRQAHSELQQLRSEWLPPSDAKLLQDKFKDSQNQIKSMRDELQRKKEVILQLREKKEQTESEAKEVFADLEGLKDDNAKLQRLIKENAKQLGLVKELKSANDQLRATERRLRDEVVQLSERLKAAKNDALRKETLARDLKDKIDMIQDENEDIRGKQSEIERVKEMNKKLKLEIEIKENQVRSLKIKLEHYEGECEQLKQSKKDDQADQQVETQLRQVKAKLVKSEKSIKKMNTRLGGLAHSVLSFYQAFKSNRNKQQSKVQSPVAKVEQDQSMKQFYKDSVNILGMSMDELLGDFVSPNLQQPPPQQHGISSNSKVWEQQLTQLIPKIGDEEVNDQVFDLCQKLLQDLRNNFM